MLLDNGRMLDGEENLAGLARTPVLRLSAATAAEIGADTGDAVAAESERGVIILPLQITDMPDRVVWVPMNSPGSTLHERLAVAAGGVVRLRRVESAPGEKTVREDRHA